METEAGATEGARKEDRRESRRAVVDYDLAAEIGSQSLSFYTGLIKNISSGGMFIGTSKRHKVGERLLIRFSLPGISGPVEVQGEVRWYQDALSVGCGMPGIGIKFLDLPAEVASKINESMADGHVLFYED